MDISAVAETTRSTNTELTASLTPTSGGDDLQQQQQHSSHQQDDDDQRWCVNSTGRYVENGVVGAIQADESNFDDRSFESEEDDDDFGAHRKLKFSKRLYGRDKELSYLDELYQSMMTNDGGSRNNGDNSNNDNSNPQDSASSSVPSAAFIGAYSGGGKSALVNEFVRREGKKHPKRSDGRLRFLFLKAKYEANFSTPLSAFSTMFDNIDDATRQELASMKDEITNVIGSDAPILGRIFPGLCEPLDLMDDGEVSLASGSQSTGMKSKSVSAYRAKKVNKEQLKNTILQFFRILCTRERPLILFIDDLQWTDEESDAIIQSLLTDNELRYLFFIGAFRSNEVDKDHALLKMFQCIEEKNGQGVKRLDLESLTQEEVGAFIADTLHLDKSEVKDLTQAVFLKTLGNPFYTRQALEYLVRKNVLFYDTISFSWAWNLDGVALEDLISDDIVDMVKHKICHLSKQMQKTMAIASHTRSSFDSETLLQILEEEGDESGFEESLSEVSTSKKDALRQILEEAVEEGLLIKGKSKADEYAFSHDRIEEAARGLIADDRREKFAGRIGSSLYSRARSQQGEDWMYFAAARHLNSSTCVANSDEERLQRAELNLRTAELSQELLAFSAAALCCRQGISNLPSDMWNSHYRIALALHTIGAESEYAIGKIPRALEYCDDILKNCDGKKSVFDKLAAYKIQVDVLAAKGDKKEAFKLSFAVLDELGLKFPMHQNKATKLRAWAALKQVKAHHIPTEEKIKELPEVSDPETFETMEFLQKAGSLAYQVENVSLYILCCCKSLRLMNEHGLVDSSASVIASFTNILMHVYDDFDGATRLAELALKLTRRLKNKFHEPRTLNTTNAFVLGWVEPLRTRLEYHIQAYNSGIVSGNVEGAGVSKMFASWVYLFSGMPLSQTATFCQNAIPQLRKQGSVFDASLISVILQISLNLMGKSNHTVLLVGEAMNQQSEPFNKPPLFFVVQTWFRFLSCFFGNWEDGAANALENSSGTFMNKMLGMMYGLETFHRAILMYGMAREGRYEYKKPAHKLLKESKQLVQKGCVNLDGPTRLLQAEHSALLKKAKQAKCSFEDAIHSCEKGEFYNYAALSSERYAKYLLEIGNRKESHKRMLQAIDFYSRWGATYKVNLLRKKVSGSDLEESAQY